MTHFWVNEKMVPELLFLNATLQPCHWYHVWNLEVFVLSLKSRCWSWFFKSELLVIVTHFILPITKVSSLSARGEVFAMLSGNLTACGFGPQTFRTQVHFLKHQATTALICHFNPDTDHKQGLKLPQDSYYELWTEASACQPFVLKSWLQNKRRDCNSLHYNSFITAHFPD